MRVLTRVSAAAAFAAALILTSACQSTPTPQAPVPGRVLVAGDSITMQAIYWGGDRGWDHTDTVMMGWQAEDAQPGVTQAVTDPARSPETLVIAFGENDQIGGFDTTDQWQAIQLALSPAPGACTVLVKPYYTGTDQARLTGIADVRAWDDQMALIYPDRIETVDWAPIATEHPGYIDEDGIHLKTTQTDPAEDMANAANQILAPVLPAAAQAYLDMFANGITACEAHHAR